MTPPGPLPNPLDARRKLEASGALESDSHQLSGSAGSPDISREIAARPGLRGVKAPRALWDVTTSASGFEWRLRDAPLEAVQALAAAHDLPEMVARLLVLRGVASEDVDWTLRPTLKALMPDPSALADMDVLAERLAQAVEAGERVCVFADYDVDGATSAALLLRLLRALGLDPPLYIPDRIAEGYGPNAEAMRSIAAQGVGLVVTLDCGATAFAPLQAAADEGLEVLVIDHHLMDGEGPPARAIVNPNRPDDTSGLGHLAAVGVSFLVCVAVLRALRQRGWSARPLPDLRDWLDVVALGTVCDVVPLTGLNRAFVVQGLKVMAGIGEPDALKAPFPGLGALARAAGVSEPPGAYHLGFMLGPRINAGGRVGRADLGARLLSETKAATCAEIAQELDALNRERRDIEAQVLAQAIVGSERALEADPDRPLLVVSGEGWHPGVIGIVASRLKDRFERPSLVLAVDGQEAKGSGRSVSGADLGAAVLEAREAGLLINGGGHAMAAGLTVAVDRIAELDAHLSARLAPAVAEARALRLLRVDATVSLAGANRALLESLERVGPFGAGAPEPLIAIRDAAVEWVQDVGESHVKVVLVSTEGARLTAMAFRARDTELGGLLAASCGHVVHVAGHLRADNYKGRNSVVLHLRDAALPTGSGLAAPPA